MTKRTIFPYQSQELNSLFEEAGNNAKVMCIPIDYAKRGYPLRSPIHYILGSRRFLGFTICA